MRDLELGRLVRLIRHRRRLTQADCAAVAGVHRSTWSVLERGGVASMSVERLRRCLGVLEIRLDLAPSWRGAEMSRLLDEHHARLASAWTKLLARWGWQTRAEVSFNSYGDRGRVDLLPWHAPSRILVVVEFKTELADVQDLLGRLDVKARLGPSLARQLGWGPPDAVVPAIVIADTSTNRRRLRSVDPLFARYGLRGKAAISWLRRPSHTPTGLLVLSVLSSADATRVRRDHAAPQRVRHRTASVAPSSDGRVTTSLSA